GTQQLVQSEGGNHHAGNQCAPEATLAGAEQRPQHGAAAEGGQQCRQQEENLGHHSRDSWLASSSSALSGTARARRRTCRNSHSALASSSTPGPNHSSQVLADICGRYSTKSP